MPFRNVVVVSDSLVVWVFDYSSQRLTGRQNSLMLPNWIHGWQVNKILDDETGSKVPFLSMGRVSVVTNKGKRKETLEGVVVGRLDLIRVWGLFFPLHFEPLLTAIFYFFIIYGGHQKDAEEFNGFYLETLEVKLPFITHPQVEENGYYCGRERGSSFPWKWWMEAGKSE